MSPADANSQWLYLSSAENRGASEDLPLSCPTHFGADPSCCRGWGRELSLHRSALQYTQWPKPRRASELLVQKCFCFWFFFSFLTGRKFVSQPSCLREQEWQRQEKKSGFGVMLSRLFVLGRMQTLADFRGDLTYTSISSFFPWIWMLHRETLRTQAMADRENVSFQRVKGKDSPFSSALVHSELSLSPNYCLFKLYWETHPVLLKTTLRR